MFTGIIQTVGHVVALDFTKKGGRLSLKPLKSLRALQIGESLAVNGCCLTVVLNHRGKIAFDVSGETFCRTNFKNLEMGEVVNLERAMTLQDRLGGHLVSGHVDATGKITAIGEHGGSGEFVVQYPEKFSKLLIDKGSVAVDGISLTVCNLRKNRFSVYVIPHTLQETNLATRKKDDLVNLEFDMVGKYVIRSKS